MPTELEELVEFLHHGNTQIRQIAAENLVGYSKSHHSIFKTAQLTPVKDLKLLVKDYAPIAKNALTILINISDDKEVLASLAKDDALLETLLLRITSSKEPNADDIAMLLANLAKDETMRRILSLERTIPNDLSTSKSAMDQLMDCFVKGAEGKYNKHANFNYLSYFFADIAKYAEGRKYFVTPRTDDADIVPLTKLTVFTEHSSVIRRRGVASTIKNVAFEVPFHDELLSSYSDSGVNLLPYLLLPLMGSEEYTDEDTEGMLDEVQLLPPDKEREKDNEIMKTHLETLLLLTTTRGGRDILRRVKVYPIIREVHLQVEDDDVREGVDRLVQVIMREEGEDTGQQPPQDELRVKETDSDEDIVEVL